MRADLVIPGRVFLVGSVMRLSSPGGESVWVLSDRGRSHGVSWMVVTASGAHAEVVNDGSVSEQGEFFGSAECELLTGVSGTPAGRVSVRGDAL